DAGRRDTVRRDAQLWELTRDLRPTISQRNRTVPEHLRVPPPRVPASPHLPPSRSYLCELAAAYCILPTAYCLRLMKLLVIKLSSIGDVVHALPAVSLIRRELPNAEISWIVERRASDVLVGSPVIDDLIVIDSR